LISLNDQDDLYNYLSFVTSDIIKNSNRIIYSFNSANNFSRLRNLIKERSFDVFILFENEPIPENLENLEKNESSNFLDEEISLVENTLLNKICCLKKDLMDEKVSEELKIEKYSLRIQHEIVHFIFYENIFNLKSTLFGTPLIEKLLKNQQNTRADSGDMVEYLMAVKKLFF